MQIKSVVLLLAAITGFSILTSANAAPVRYGLSGTTIDTLSFKDQNQLQRQVDLITEIARVDLGMLIAGNRNDLRLLQTMVDRELINQDEVFKLQSMGAVLGNVYVRELGLQWRVYEDRQGRSRAICVPKTDHCLFPITMLSRRMEAGLKPDVMKIYKEGQRMIAPHLPRSPYDSSI
ncbi:DUF3806 domain-containing protein [Pseudomaricurvus alkylphenolicus]|jgi:formyltetrahydrofolate hydrolase|uniref:DUF3806 domain-containing protein n=1 Tax=Pseudomaricurvus alkylphenolicus TaxID=1306991 RepID=UPI0014212F71|nr:DUF3806 domain-containing protein [Pseudomaricurvus alkylphenolicus]NIB41094.1 DUF3806 domain-containing protein [Pseudomaricurvus alkylphenolicus]